MTDTPKFKVVKRLAGKQRINFEKKLLQSAGARNVIHMIATKSLPKKDFWSWVIQEYKCKKPSYDFFSGEIRDNE